MTGARVYPLPVNSPPRRFPPPPSLADPWRKKLTMGPPPRAESPPPPPSVPQDANFPPGLLGCVTLCGPGCGGGPGRLRP
jgi:hypothetical protein